MRRLVQDEATAFERVVLLWQLYNVGQAKRLGPVSELCVQLRGMGWQWKQAAVFERTGRRDFHLAHGPD